MKLPADAELIEVGIDWLTSTATDKAMRKALAAECEKILRHATRHGDELRSFHWKGYEGLCVDGCDLGIRYDSVMVRLHGATANLYWWDVMQVSQNWTRLDLQTTWRITSESVNRTLARSWRAVQQTKLRGKAVEWHYRRDSSRGDTLEVGRRCSEQFGRAYNKALESKLDHYANCFRLENEFKGGHAASRLRAIAGADNTRACIAGQVADWWQARGVVSTRLQGWSHILDVRQRPADLDSRLRWLHNSVRGCVDRCVADGRLDDVLIALGLDNVVQRRLNGPDATEQIERRIKHDAAVSSTLDRISDWANT